MLVWKDVGGSLGIDMDEMYTDLESLKYDRVKWSRRATREPSEAIAKEIRSALGVGEGVSLVGIQMKRARENCCFTDLKEANAAEQVEGRLARHVHPKNPAVKFTNYSFDVVPQLKLFRERYAIILGPYGDKFKGQFAELNKYFDKQRGTRAEKMRSCSVTIIGCGLFSRCGKAWRH